MPISYRLCSSQHTDPIAQTRRHFDCGIYALVCCFLDNDRDIANFLRIFKDDLDLLSIGEFLGEPDQDDVSCR